MTGQNVNMLYVYDISVIHTCMYITCIIKLETAAVQGSLACLAPSLNVFTRTLRSMM